MGLVFLKFLLFFKSTGNIWVKKQFLFTLLLESSKSDHVLSDYLHSGKMDGHIMLYYSVLLIHLPDSCPAADSVIFLFCGRDGLEMFSFICYFKIKIGY